MELEGVISRTEVSKLVEQAIPGGMEFLKYNAPNEIYEMACLGLQKLESPRVQGRIEYVKKVNPDVDITRISIPLEIHDVVGSYRNYKSFSGFTKLVPLTILSTVSLMVVEDIAARLCHIDPSHLKGYTLGYEITKLAILSVPFIGLSRHLGKITGYLQDPVFGKPLSEREFELNRYIFRD
jgi:hypothetical protein